MTATIHEKYKYNRLISILRKKIFAGEFDQTGKLPPERKLAEQFGFSRITIRTALQELCEDGLIEQRRGSGNFIRKAAQNGNHAPEFHAPERRFAFLCNRNKTAFELPVEEDPYNSQLLLGFLRSRTEKRPFTVDPIPVVPGEPLMAQLTERKISLRDWDGLLIASPLSENDFNDLERLAVPFVVQGETVSARYFPMVTVNNFRGAYDATRHLIENGRSRPLFLSADFKMPWAERRSAGFRQALLDAGLAFSSEQLISLRTQTRENATHQMTELLASDTKFDSMIVLGDWSTLGILEALKHSGLRVPEDVSVINYDGYTWLFNCVTPRLTHVTQPFARIGECCIEMLFDLIEHPGNETQIKVIPPLLVVQESTRMKGESAV